MRKVKKYIDLVFLTLFGLSIVLCIYLHFAEGFVLSINNYIAFGLWLVIVLLKVTKPGKEFFGVFIMLVLALIGVINFSVYAVNASMYHTGGGLLYNGPGINVFILLLLIVYCGINIDMVKRIFKGSEKEQLEAENKMVEFYYNKFAGCGENELSGIIEKFKDYPYEAQVAIKQISRERKALSQ